MEENPRYLKEFVCGNCARTGHVTWEGTGVHKRVVEKTEIVTSGPGGDENFACAHCGEVLQPI